MELKIRKQIEVGFNPAVNSSIARCNFHFSSVAGIILCFLPTENTLFKGHPYAFYACVVSVVFTFTGSFSALMIGDKSKISRFLKPAQPSPTPNMMKLRGGNDDMSPIKP
ncbi:hypothetical protein J1N35_016734 [Gossypium stocksii]|uniref:Uncharacterized protein n=1 Tax=Gossypium stocksii TaxID=47602 RepID=A0A9D3VLV5_9ROSI|nr:hypothetical protein J1N35_016734 [Gossypium stocksii]